MTQLPILHSNRASYGWVEEIEMLRTVYKALVALDPERAARDEARLDASIVWHSLRIAGVEVDRAQVEAIRAGSPDAEVDPAVRGALAAVARLRAVASSGGEMGPELLLEINGLVDPARGGRLRSTPPVAAYQGHEAPGHEVLERLLANVAEWFAAPSFATDMHPVEQAALALVRLCDLQPFPASNELTARIAVSFFSLRAGLPPLVIREESEPDYRTALLHALHMDTTLMVELLASCLLGAFEELGARTR